MLSWSLMTSLSVSSLLMSPCEAEGVTSDGGGETLLRTLLLPLAMAALLAVLAMVCCCANTVCNSCSLTDSSSAKSTKWIKVRLVHHLNPCPVKASCALPCYVCIANYQNCNYPIRDQREVKPDNTGSLTHKLNC